MKGVQIPWEAYAHYSTASPVPLPSSTTPAGSPNSTPRSNRMRDPLAQLNNLAESRRMMADTGMMGGGGEGETGMSFAMLCRLISEGRTGEVGGIQEIPDQLNVGLTLVDRAVLMLNALSAGNTTFPIHSPPTTQTMGTKLQPQCHFPDLSEPYTSNLPSTRLHSIRLQPRLLRSDHRVRFRRTRPDVTPLTNPYADCVLTIHHHPDPSVAFVSN